jgi:hypothetical protein
MRCWFSVVSDDRPQVNSVRFFSCSPISRFFSPLLLSSRKTFAIVHSPRAPS